MFFLIRMVFWFSLVLLVLPLDAGNDDAPAVGPLQAISAARAAIGDVAGLCQREPEVCDTGRAAFATIAGRAREGARIAYGLLGEDAAPAAEGVPASTQAALDARMSTGSVVPVLRPQAPLGPSQ